MEDFPETALITPFSPSSTSSSQFWTEATGRPVLTAVDLKQSTLDFCFNIDYSFPEHLLITGEFSTDVEIGLAHCRLQLHSGCTQLVFRDVSLSIARAHCSYCPTSRLTNLDKSASESRRDSRYLRHNMTTLEERSPKCPAGRRARRCTYNIFVSTVQSRAVWRYERPGPTDGLQHCPPVTRAGTSRQSPPLPAAPASLLHSAQLPPVAAHRLVRLLSLRLLRCVWAN